MQFLINKIRPSAKLGCASRSCLLKKQFRYHKALRAMAQTFLIGRVWLINQGVVLDVIMHLDEVANEHGSHTLSPLNPDLVDRL